MPRLREDFSAPSPFHVIPAAGRTEPAGDDPVREVRPASAAQPSVRALRPRGRAVETCRRSPTRSAPASACSPIFERIQAHVFSAGRVHGDDTTVPVLAKGKTDTAHIWTYVRDDRPFDGCAAGRRVLLFARQNRRAPRAPSCWLFRHPAGRRLRRIQPALRRRPVPARSWEAACWAHAWQVLSCSPMSRRALDVERRTAPSPIFLSRWKPVRRIDVLFDIERAINGLDIAARKAARRERSVPVVAELESWMRAERATMSRHNDVAKAMNYMLQALERFHPVPRRRTDLYHEQRRRTGLARDCARPQVLVVRRLRPRRPAPPPPCIP